MFLELKTCYSKTEKEWKQKNGWNASRPALQQWTEGALNSLKHVCAGRVSRLHAPWSSAAPLHHPPPPQAATTPGFFGSFFSDCLWASLLFINLSALIVTHSLGCQRWSHALLFTHSFFGTLTEIPSERWNAPSSNILKHPLKKREWPSSAKRRACTCRVHTVTGEILHCKGYCSQSMWVTCTLCTWS